MQFTCDSRDHGDKVEQQDGLPQAELDLVAGDNDRPGDLPAPSPAVRFAVGPLTFDPGHETIPQAER